MGSKRDQDAGGAEGRRVGVEEVRMMGTEEAVVGRVVGVGGAMVVLCGGGEEACGRGVRWQGGERTTHRLLWILVFEEVDGMATAWRRTLRSGCGSERIAG